MKKHNYKAKLIGYFGKHTKNAQMADEYNKLRLRYPAQVADVFTQTYPKLK